VSLHHEASVGTSGDAAGNVSAPRQPMTPFSASVSEATREWMLSLVHAAATETEHGTAGGETMLAKVAELMFVEVIRKYIDGLPQDARGWCSGLRDPQVGAAIHLLHERPAHRWTVDSLVREVGMSRSTFAERFGDSVGAPPIHYLGKWRLQLAASLLVNRG
jgi:transcriptional regulator GlxA family with amidase domain